MSRSTHAQRDIDRLIAAYAASHQNARNERIHFVCVPAIVLAVLGILWRVHPLLALILTAAALLYYVTLSLPLAFGMLAMAALMLGAWALVPVTAVLPLALAIFVTAWIGQFIGHKIEGKKPSFLDDLRFLLIGPLFVLGFAYRRWHIAY